jgi:hypothetical protein
MTLTRANRVWWTMMAVVLLTALLGLVACNSDDSTDGDVDGDVADGDTPDGDVVEDGDVIEDGDEPVDGDVADGDEPIDGDVVEDGDEDGDLEDMTDFERCVAESCGDELATCEANPDCASLLDCIRDCDPEQSNCQENCVATNPMGASDFAPLQTCVVLYCENV